MSKKAPRDNWLIPIPPGDIPEGFRCVQVLVPDADAYEQELVGLVARAASWVSYQRESAHKAADVARAWQAAILASGSLSRCSQEGDNMQIRECQSGCGIEWSTDGINWTCIDLSGCIETIWDEKLAGAFDDGVLGKGTGAQNPETPPTPGVCQVYYVKLAPGAKWLCPTPIDDAYTVQVTGARGGWSIGELAWYCPDGARYLLGICDETLHTHVGSDPSASLWHMQLAGNYLTTYFDPTTLYTVPIGTGQQPLYLLANTGLTGVPSGEVEFTVTVCNGQYVHVFYNGHDGNGYFTYPYAGQGVYDAANDRVNTGHVTNWYAIVRLDLTGRNVKSVRMKAHLNQRYSGRCGITFDASHTAYNNNPVPSSNDLDIYAEPHGSTFAEFGISDLSAGGYIWEITVIGGGADPF